MLGISSAVFKSLNIKNYRYFFLGQTVSVTGGWLQMTAMPWLVYEMTGSAAMLGTVAFLNQIFMLIIAPFAGSFADKFNRKRMILLTQSVLCLSSGALALLTLSGYVKIWHIVFIAVVNGLTNSFDMTLRQSFVLDLVPKNNLMNAIGLNSLVNNSARVVGPALAGIVIAKLGAGYCFLVNSLSFACAITALIMIRPLRQNIENAVTSLKDKFINAAKFLKKEKTVAYMLILLAIVGLVMAFPMVLIPVFVKDVYNLGAQGLGIFMTSIGVGAVFATVTIASKTDMKGIKEMAVYAAFTGGIFIILLGIVVNLYLACVFLAFMGFCLVLVTGVTNTFIQITAPPENRGTIIGFFITAFMGLTPFGSIMAGHIAHAAGPRITAIAGGAVIVSAVILLYRKILK
ncbi:MAG: MFS transporter [Endomicrobium sp.]|jgi:MFS family permease|nr:MFS transporter [Endomicrobium sp.]